MAQVGVTDAEVEGMEHEVATDSSPPQPVATTATPSPTDVGPTPAPEPSDRPETLAQALGQDGPGIAAEIESVLGGSGDRLGILSQLPVTLTARLSTTLQPLGSILSLQPGTRIDLGRVPDAPIELVANGVVVAYGEVVAVGSTLGVRITALARS